MANYLNKPSIFDIATAFEDGKNGEIKQKTKTNVVVNTNRIGYGDKSTVSAFLATAYDGQGNAVDSMEGYFLEPVTNYERAKKAGSDTSIMFGEYNVVSGAECRWSASCYRRDRRSGTNRYNCRSRVC
jgi:hypothetical protein